MAKRRSKKRMSKQTRTILAKILGILFSIAFVVALRLFFRDYYEFVDVFLFPLWYVAFGIGVIAAAVILYLFLSHDGGVWIGLLLFFGVTLASFFLMGLLFTHINHIFDFSEPQRYVAVIEDTDSYGGYGKHGIREYEFTLTINGETMDIRVPFRDYIQFEIGDLYAVEYHKGAFNEPYYIYAGGVSEVIENAP